MELDFAFLSSAADFSEGKFSVIGGGIDTFNVNKLPALVPPIAVLFRFSISEDERDKDHTFSIRLKTPSGAAELLVESRLPFDKYSPGRRLRSTTAVQAGFQFTDAGRYGLEILGDGRAFTELDLFVNVTPALGEQK
jgi:hypothetical protein